MLGRELVVVSLLVSGLLVAPAAAAPTPAVSRAPAGVPAAGTPGIVQAKAVPSVMPSAKKKPRASLSASALALPSGKIRVTVTSNATKAKLTYRTASNKKRTATVKIRQGSGGKTLAKGSQRIKAQARATSKVRASRWARVVITAAGGTPSAGSTPAVIAGVSGAQQIVSGSLHSCALVVDGSVRCWGSNWKGQLGIGAASPYQMIAERVVGLSGVVQLAAGGQRSCAVSGAGSVWCWGNVGFGTFDEQADIRPSPTQVPEIVGASQVAVGGLHACAVVAGQVACWGSNGAGQLGDGSYTNAATPVPVLGLSNVVAVTAGDWHTCALTGSGDVHCWGSDNLDQMGDGTRSHSAPLPTVVPRLAGASSITSGGDHTCAIVAGGGIRCVGNDYYGQASSPQAATGAVRLAADRDMTCAILGAGLVKCWGFDDFGQLGDGTITDAVSLSSGERFGCALVRDGTARCWGKHDLTGSDT